MAKLTYEVVEKMLLEKKKLSIYDIAIEFEVSLRTAKDYLTVLCIKHGGAMTSTECRIGEQR